MLFNYIKIAWRNLRAQPFFTLLNTFGLAIGMAGALLMALYIYDELSYDKMFADSDRIYRVNADIKFGGEKVSSSKVTAPMAKTLEIDYPQVELTTRFRQTYSISVRKSDAVSNVKETNTTRVDPSFFEMFGLELLYGNTETALNETNGIVLTKSAALKHFDLDNAIGQTLVIDNADTFVVTGIIDDLPMNSFLRDYSVFLSMVEFGGDQENNWGNNNFSTFVKLLPSANIEEFEEGLTAIFDKYIIPFAQTFMPGITKDQFIAAGNYYNLSLINIKDIHLYSNRGSEMSPNGNIQNIYILSFIALFLIVLASVNFMNLSTANSLKRAKEVGVRKTLGSRKGELISQFLTESGIITFISLLFAVLLVTILLPSFNNLADKSIVIPFLNPLFWIILLVSNLTLGLFSGIYPAFFMSRFIPVKVLKGNSDIGGKSGVVRSFLVVFQFSISVFLIVSTLVVFKQLKYIQNKELGYDKERVIIINDVFALGNQVQSFKNEVQQLSQVQDVSLSSFVPTPSSRNGTSFFQEGSSNQEDAIQMQRWSVDYNYINTLGLEIVEGRPFDQKFGTDSLAMIINETAAKFITDHPEEALGKRIAPFLETSEANFYHVIGVVKDFHFKSLRDDIGALCMLIGDSSNSMIVKLNPGDFSSALSKMESSWKSISPGQPFTFSFMEENYNNIYESEQRLGHIFTIFTVLSILIACLGLFGLAAFNAERRSKEIGIRKVLGASVGQITYKLSIDFLKLVVVAIIVSIPFSWYAMDKWLQDFTYRIEIGWGVFALAILLAIVISVITLSFQSIKAAIVNPIKSLRTE